MSTTYDKAELEAISILRLMAKRSKLRSRKAQLKEASVVTPLLRQQIEHINEQIAQISKQIFARTGERE